jgi:DNA-binding NtrC family response regulator
MQIGVASSLAVENKRVFVVDGDEITRAVLQFMLHDENETHEFGALAQVYAKAVDWKPDALLLGLDLVQVHGLGVLEEIRARIPGVRIAVVCDTAAAPAARECLAHGAHSLLARPLTIESVRRKVDLLLGRRTALAIPVHMAPPAPP